MKKILVCGGAGYIGSHMAKMLSQNGYEVITFDNLSTGHEKSVKWGKLVIGDLLRPKNVADLFNQHDFEAVFHFGARSLVGESVTYPDMYYRNNVIGTLNLLDAMMCTGVENIIFSSTAAIFGNPEYTPIDEEHPKHPVNPYGSTKIQVEQILQDYAQTFNLNSVSLRYFNAAGADPEGLIGEQHEPETHLIPNILNSLLGDKKRLQVFGIDYDTKDGTCVRDYIHINDLCRAHLSALDLLKKERGSFNFNLGNGQGFSVLDVIKATESVTGEIIKYDTLSRRNGDPAILIADSSQAKEILGWQPEYTRLEDIIETAWKWHKTLHKNRENKDRIKAA